MFIFHFLPQRYKRHSIPTKLETWMELFLFLYKMQFFTLVSIFAAAALADNAAVITQIGDGQIQAPTTPATETTVAPTVVPSATTSIPVASSTAPEFENAAPRAAVGAGAAVVAVAALLM